MDIEAIGAVATVILGSGAMFVLAQRDRRKREAKEQGIGQDLAATKQRAESSAKLAEPCNVSVTRLSSFVAAVVPSAVFLNGNRVGVLKNGGTLNLSTEYADNELMIRNPVDRTIQFEGVPGGLVKLEFSTKARGGGSLTLR